MTISVCHVEPFEIKRVRCQSPTVLTLFVFWLIEF